MIFKEKIIESNIGYEKEDFHYVYDFYNIESYNHLVTLVTSNCKYITSLQRNQTLSDFFVFQYDLDYLNSLENKHAKDFLYLSNVLNLTFKYGDFYNIDTFDFDSSMEESKLSFRNIILDKFDKLKAIDSDVKSKLIIGSPMKPLAIIEDLSVFSTELTIDTKNNILINVELKHSKIPKELTKMSIEKLFIN